ncbi:hypothetical protein [Microcoleus sp. CAWBG24]|uniref:hypothetical protein n=1 Tax=Microcoleus sp. CAWBG24 TaxID=2841644 RepID=UPI0025CDEF18|nr:hypothetical protein [Microcoleus sp. CAWBG24]
MVESRNHFQEKFKSDDSLLQSPSFFCQLSTKRAGTGAPPLPPIDCQLSTVNC